MKTAKREEDRETKKTSVCVCVEREREKEFTSFSCLRSPQIIHNPFSRSSLDICVIHSASPSHVWKNFFFFSSPLSSFF